MPIAKPLQRFRDNPLKRLNRLSLYCEQRSMQRLEEQGFTKLAMHFAAPMSLLAQHPYRLTTLAERMAMSKQLCLQSLRPLEQAGYIARRQDPHDRRAKLIGLSPRGAALVSAANSELGAINREFSQQIGDDAMQFLNRFAQQLCAALQLPGFEPGFQPANQGLNFSLLVGMINRSIHRQLMQSTIARGHSELQMSHGQVLACIAPEGSSIGELASENGVSSQAISRTARQLSSLGYIARTTDPEDGRSQRLRLSDSGMALIADAVAAMDDWEKTLQSRLGEDDYQRFCALITALSSAVFNTPAPGITETLSPPLRPAELLQYLAGQLGESPAKPQLQSAVERRLGETGRQQLEQLLAFATGRAEGRQA